MEKTKLHLPKRLSDVLCYIIVLFALLVFSMEKYDVETRFVATQSICIWILGIILKILLQVILLFASVLPPIVSIVIYNIYLVLTTLLFILVVFLVIAAIFGKRVKVPYIKDWARKIM